MKTHTTHKVYLELHDKRIIKQAMLATTQTSHQANGQIGVTPQNTDQDIFSKKSGA